MGAEYLRRPAGRSDVVTGRALHNDCGGEVRQMRNYWGEGAGPFRCQTERCSGQWSEDAIENRFTARDIEDRFHVQIHPPSTLEVLVWVADPVTKQRHTSLVSRWDAEGLERVKV